MYRYLDFEATSDTLRPPPPHHHPAASAGTAAASPFAGGCYLPGMTLFAWRIGVPVRYHPLLLLLLLLPLLLLLHHRHLPSPADAGKSNASAKKRCSPWLLFHSGGRKRRDNPDTDATALAPRIRACGSCVPRI